MDIMAVIALISKGVSVIEMLVEAGKSAIPAITVVKNLITGAQQGTITDDELAQAEAELDAQIDEFNAPI